MALRRLLIGSTVVSGASYAGLKYTEAGEGFYRFGSTVYCAARVVLDFKLEKYKHPETPTRLRKELHQRSADRILGLCKQHGGILIKAGQYIGTMNHVLPTEYTSTLSQLQDSAPTVPFERIKPVLLESLNVSDLGEVFETFNEKPTAAASLAQVHYAVTNEKFGKRECAIKVQYPGLSRQVRGDLFSLKVITDVVGYLFPDYAYGWMLPEFKKVAEEELDFNQEAKNGMRTKKSMEMYENVYVPTVYNDLTSRRVLGMEWIHGARVTDNEAISRFGFSSPKIAETVFKIFGDMIFVNGHVHCDPHPGNLMVRPNPKDSSNFQVVILDHGMYRELSKDFRIAYCNLWKAMVTGDNALGRSCVQSMGMKEDYYDILSLILTFRPPSSGSDSQKKLGERMSKEERRKLREKFKGTTMGDVNKFMESLPRDFLFVLRSTNIVRSLNKDLGGTSRDRFLAMAKSAIKGVELEAGRLQAGQGHVGYSPLFASPSGFLNGISAFVRGFWWWLFRLTIFGM